MKQQILTAGFGGQGVLLLGQLLAEAAMREGLHATWFPSYGPEMRGGTANCATVISDEEIGAPIANAYDAVIAMNQPSLERFGPIVRRGGLLLVNEDMAPRAYERPDIEILYVAASRLARQAGAERAANVVLLGALLAARPIVRVEAIEDALRGLIGSKKPELVQPNLAALRAGLDAARESIAAAAH